MSLPYATSDNIRLTFSDPFGLCPYVDDADGNRSTNVGDCPDDARKGVFERLQSNKTGQWAIRQVTDMRLNVSLNTSACQPGASGCADIKAGTIMLDPEGTTSALASTTVHETFHFTYRSLAPNMANTWAEEAGAQMFGLYFYSQLPNSLQDDPTRTYWSKQMQSNPGAALSFICNSNYSHLNCP